MSLFSRVLAIAFVGAILPASAHAEAPSTGEFAQTPARAVKAASAETLLVTPDLQGLYAQARWRDDDDDDGRRRRVSPSRSSQDARRGRDDDDDDGRPGRGGGRHDDDD